ncbi:MAG: DUF5317 domain-containing protein [Chloroflexi bacterium]|nr:DUF5317 domain-containing protein [Chloroflexota bacterium]
MSQLRYVSVRAYGVVLVAFGIQMVLLYFPVPEVVMQWMRTPALYFSYVLLAAFVWQNRQLRGMWLVAAGLGANALVIAANGGYMPVTYEAVVAAGKAHLVASSAAGALVFGSKDVLLPASQTTLWLLSDIFVIPPPFPVPSVFSLGDALLALGMFRLVPCLFGASGVAPQAAAT